MRGHKTKTITTYRQQIEAAINAGFEKIYVPGTDGMPGAPSGGGWVFLRKWLEEGDRYDPSPLDDVIEDPIELPFGGTVGLWRCVIGRDVYAAIGGSNTKVEPDR